MRFSEINHNYKVCACPIGESMIVEDTRNGCSTCQKCGIVVADMYIDTEHEAIRSFEGEDNAMTSKEASFGSSTKVDVPSFSVPSGKSEKAIEKEEEGGDVMGKLLKARASKEEIKLSKLESRIKSKSSFFKLNQNISGFALKMAKEFETKREKYSRANIDVFAIAALYLACKHFDVARSLEELTEGDKTNVKKAGVMVKKIRKLKLNCFGDDSDDSSTPIKITSGSDLIPRVCHNLGIKDYSDEKKIEKLAKKGSDFLAGRQPKTIAAASLLFYITEVKKIAGINMEAISNACKVDQSTIRKSFAILSTEKGALLSAILI